MPRRSTTSRSEPVIRAWKKALSGHSILPRQTLVERDVRPRRLEVEEALRIDVRKPLGVPELREIAEGEGRTLAAVVPPPERGDEDRALELRPTDHPQLFAGHASV